MTIFDIMFRFFRMDRPKWLIVSVVLVVLVVGFISMAIHNLFMKRYRNVSRENDIVLTSIENSRGNYLFIFHLCIFYDFFLYIFLEDIDIDQQPFDVEDIIYDEINYNEILKETIISETYNPTYDITG